MQERETAVDSFDELHTFVHTELCNSENLLEEQFRTHRNPLFMKGQLCGIEYSLQGLRAIRLGAIWAADQNVVYLYNAKGERSVKIKLTKRLPLELAAAG